MWKRRKVNKAYAPFPVGNTVRKGLPSGNPFTTETSLRAIRIREARRSLNGL